ncbi:MarR family transcriptional regulator [Clostridium sp. C8-1-8]|uniref:MarR family winged helix-turn-helix transcriptional regulator n=1 Tax=Clostridium sp. C8-1-8 TaxID=2698831 RepID=UPI00136A6F4F|nr:MarR family transcriptional regulator [Clostridium sp. C8-1-8]
MEKLEMKKDKQYLFGAIFVAANRIDTMLEREFSQFDITTKQWFLSIIIDNLFDAPPTIKEVAKEMGSSHQNVKQIALKLEQKGLLILEKDNKDSRATRLKLSESGYDFWDKIKEEGICFTEELFKGIREEDLSAARRVFKQILFNINSMDKNNV